MWSLKTETVPVVIGAPGLVKKGVGQYLKKKKNHSFIQNNNNNNNKRIPSKHYLHWALSIYEKNPEISVVAKVEFPIGKKLFHLVVNPGTWRGARPWTWNWYKRRET